MPKPEMTIEEASVLEANSIRCLNQMFPSWLGFPKELRAALVEAAFANGWLAMRLACDFGCSASQIEPISLVYGQLCAGHPDPWEVACEVLRLHEAGTLPDPGGTLKEAVSRRNRELGWDAREERLDAMLNQAQSRTHQ